MVTMWKRRAASLALYGAVLVGVLGLAPAAYAQISNEPWSAPLRDRAGLAVAMKQIESGVFGSSNSNTGAGTQIVCGGPQGTASATANFSCIIVGDGAYASVDTAQDSVGDQTASSIVDGVEQALNGDDPLLELPSPPK